jgi:hypothetical protein
VIFLHPLALLALAGAAIPALLHLFHRRTPPEAEFPPLRYLTEAERRSARRLRLRHLLLLILRTALIVAVVVAAARPFVRARSAGAGHPPSAIALVLDNSLSSGSIAGGQLTLDRLKAAARSVLVRATPADRLWLVLADGIARAGSSDELMSAVDSAPVQPVRLDLVDAVRRAALLVAAEPTAEHGIVVLSDLQRSALASGRAEIPAGVSVTVLAAGRVPQNRGVAAARMTASAVVVTLSGNPEAGPTPVTLRLRSREVARALASAGATVTLPFAYPGPGWWTAEVSVERDELRADDRRVAVWHAVPPARVRAAPGSGPFVAAALAVLRDGGRIREGSDVTIDERPGASASIVMPPLDPSLTGEVNRALAARGIPWRFGAPGTPGTLTGAVPDGLDGIPVRRRLRLEGVDSGLVLARVNGEPWAVSAHGVVLLGSRLDSAWTTLPLLPAFIPFLDGLVNQFVRGDDPIQEREGAPRVEFARVGPDTVGATVFGPDARESDLAVAEPSLVSAALGGEPRVADDLADQVFAGAGRADLTGLLLLLAVVLALAELAVATVAR